MILCSFPKLFKLRLGDDLVLVHIELDIALKLSCRPVLWLNLMGLDEFYSVGVPKFRFDSLSALGSFRAHALLEHLVLPHPVAPDSFPLATGSYRFSLCQASGSPAISHFFEFVAFTMLGSYRTLATNPIAPRGCPTGVSFTEKGALSIFVRFF